LIAQRNLPGESSSSLRAIPLTTALAARLAQVDVAAFAWSNTGPSNLPDAFQIPGDWAYAGCPLAVAGQAHGWLSCYREGSAPFNVSETTFLMAVARQLGVMVENHRLRQRIGQAAVVEERQRLARDLHDSVTQLIYSLTLFARAGMEAAADGDDPRLRHSLNRMQATSLTALRDVMDLIMPRVSGVEATAQILQDNPGARVLILTSFGTEESVRQALRAGAMGFLPKESQPVDLLQAIRSVHHGQLTIPRNIARALYKLDPQSDQLEPQLTGREEEVLIALARGLSNRQIADQLNIGENTVRTHVGSLLRKLELSNRTELAIYALKRDPGH